MTHSGFIEYLEKKEKELIRKFKYVNHLIGSLKLNPDSYNNHQIDNYVTELNEYFVIRKLELKFENKPINFEKIKISERLRTILFNYKIENVYQLTNITEKEYLNFRNSGIITLQELKKIMAEYEIEFRSEKE
jgi:DNA-directed RNA polymerase alpha subunit